MTSVFPSVGTGDVLSLITTVASLPLAIAARPASLARDAVHRRGWARKLANSSLSLSVLAIGIWLAPKTSHDRREIVDVLKRESRVTEGGEGVLGAYGRLEFDEGSALSNDFVSSNFSSGMDVVIYVRPPDAKISPIDMIVDVSDRWAESFLYNDVLVRHVVSVGREYVKEHKSRLYS